MGGKIFFSFFYWGSKNSSSIGVFCLQYLTIKVCNDKPLSINFAVLKSKRHQQTNKQNTNKQNKEKDYGK